MLKEKIKYEVGVVLKSGDNFLTTVLRMLLASFITKEKEKRFKISKQKPDIKEDDLVREAELTDQEIIEIIISEIKKRKDAIVLYERGNRPELAEKEKKEIVVLQKYLPEQLSEQELKKIIQEAILKTGAREIKDIGKVMAEINSKIKGKADPSEANKIVKDLLLN